jgi:hypothetical protein
VPVDEASSPNGPVFVWSCAGQAAGRVVASTAAVAVRALLALRASLIRRYLVQLSLFPIFTQLVADLTDGGVAYRARRSLLQPGDEAEIIEMVMPARLCFAWFGHVIETYHTVFGGMVERGFQDWRGR